MSGVKLLKLDKKNLFSAFVFLLSPIIGIMVAIHGLKKNQLNFLYILISLFFALIFLKNPPLDDLYRYLEMYDYLNPTVVFNEISNYTVFNYIAYIMKLIGIPFYLMASIYVFFIIYLSLKAINVVFIYFDWDVRFCLWVILGLIILINPIIASLSLRAPLAMSLFTCGFVHLFFGSKIKSSILLFLSVVFHFSFLYLVVAVLFSKFYKVGGKQAILLSALFFLMSNKVLPALIPLIPFASVSAQFTNYITNTAVGEGVDGSSALVVNGVLFVTILYFMVFPIILKAPKFNFNDLQRYKSGIHILIMFVCLSAFQYLVFFRYSFSIILIEYIYIVIHFKYIGGKVLFVSLLFLLAINLLLIDVYIRKDSLMLGSPISLAVLPPAHTVLYTDSEYREFLEVIDKDGLLK